MQQHTRVRRQEKRVIFLDEKRVYLVRCLRLGISSVQFRFFSNDSLREA